MNKSERIVLSSGQVPEIFNYFGQKIADLCSIILSFMLLTPTLYLSFYSARLAESNGTAFDLVRPDTGHPKFGSGHRLP